MERTTQRPVITEEEQQETSLLPHFTQEQALFHTCLAALFDSFAEIAIGLDIDFDTVAQWMEGDTNPGLPNTLRIAYAILGIQPDEEEQDLSTQMNVCIATIAKKNRAPINHVAKLCGRKPHSNRQVLRPQTLAVLELSLWSWVGYNLNSITRIDWMNRDILVNKRFRGSINNHKIPGVTRWRNPFDIVGNYPEVEVSKVEVQYTPRRKGRRSNGVNPLDAALPGGGPSRLILPADNAERKKDTDDEPKEVDTRTDAEIWAEDPDNIGPNPYEPMPSNAGRRLLWRENRTKEGLQ